MNTTTIGLDIEKAVFQVHGVDARGSIPHFKAGSTAAISPAIARSQKGLAQRGASIYGNFNSRITAWKRGSLRSGSTRKSVFSECKPGSRTRTALSSSSSALARFPH